MSKLVVISAPSGAGKTSIANCLINRIEQLSFSISATSRSPRVDEKDSVNYYFKSIDEFKNDINKNLLTKSVIPGSSFKNYLIDNLKIIDDKLFVSHDNGVFELPKTFDRGNQSNDEIVFYDYNELLNESEKILL